MRITKHFIPLGTEQLAGFLPLRWGDVRLARRRNSLSRAQGCGVILGDQRRNTRLFSAFPLHDDPAHVKRRRVQIRRHRLMAGDRGTAGRQVTAALLEGR
jgi:hypothetical protein